MPLIFNPVGKSKFNANFTINGSSCILQYPCGEDIEECSPYFGILPRGQYIFEVWGAQGGLSGGAGGYSIGFIKLKYPTPIYITIGAQGSYIENIKNFTTTAYNGGGKGFAHCTTLERSAGSGGGATDIRLIGNTFDHRVLVAGGGGGNCTAAGLNVTPGVGGGETGGDSATGKGGTQESSPHVSTGIGPGSFGIGGSAQIDEGTAGGGGGGWYGGSSGKQSSANGGAGGSGYALHQNSYKPEGYKINDPNYFFSYWHLYDGNSQVPKCESAFSNTMEYEKGHSGFGCARITFLINNFATKKKIFFRYIPQTLLFINIFLK